MDVYSSVGSLDNDWLQGIHISLVHVIISDMCIPCCGRYTIEDSEAPEILSYEEMLGVNISSEPVLKIQMKWEFFVWVDSQYNSCVPGDTHITTL